MGRQRSSLPVSRLVSLGPPECSSGPLPREVTENVSLVFVASEGVLSFYFHNFGCLAPRGHHIRNPPSNRPWLLVVGQIGSYIVSLPQVGCRYPQNLLVVYAHPGQFSHLP